MPPRSSSTPRTTSGVATTITSSISLKESGSDVNTNWSMVRSTKSDGVLGFDNSELRFTYGSDPVAQNNRSGLSIKGTTNGQYGLSSDSRVGINVNDPVAQLTVSSRWAEAPSILVGTSFASNGDAELFLSEGVDRDLGMSIYDGDDNQLRIAGKNTTTGLNTAVTINRDTGRVSL